MSYSDLIDPYGGGPTHGAPDLALGVIAMDLGLGMGGMWAAGKAYMGFGKRGQFGGYRSYMARNLGAVNVTSGMMFEAHSGRDMTSFQKATQRRILGQEIRSARKAARTSFGKIGRGLRTTGLLAAAVSLASFGLNIGMSIAEPGIRKEVLERDKQLFSDESLMDSRQAWTQRQRAIQAIGDSQLSVGRALIGREAEFLHR